MEDKEYRETRESKEKILQIYSDFMTRITIFEELVGVGTKLLVSFQQALGFLGRPPINKTSDLAMRIIKGQETKRLKSYVHAGCLNSNDSIQNINKSRVVISELEGLLDDAAAATVSGNWPLLPEEHVNGKPDINFPKYENEELPSLGHSKPEEIDYAAQMAIVYSMLKQEYVMQERIVGSLNLKSSPEELESYCLVWSLRPFVDDDVMHEAWRIVR